MKCRTYLLQLLLLLTPAAAFSQWQPVHSLGVLNPFQDHPAAAGSARCMEVHLGHRSQWLGIEGAPVNSFVNLHGHRKSGRTNFQGYGLRIETDRAGAWSETAVRFGWAYNMKLQRGHRLAAGISAGLGQVRLNWGELRLPEVGAANDPAIAGAQQAVGPMLDVGLWYYSRAQFVGFTIEQMTQPALAQVGRDARISRQVNCVVGQDFELERNLSLEPILNVRLTKGIPPTVDAWLWMNFNQRLLAGAGYRNQSALLFGLQAQIAPFMHVAYSYDAGIGALGGRAGATHEIMLALNACRGGGPSDGTACPAFD
jgi:type IX secretion system PorP/SprF family membrane protein